MQVQSGGSFDVDYSVYGPNEKVIMEGSKERQGDFVFTAKEQGEYRFCFNNEMSTFAEKMVDFEIAVWPMLPLILRPAQIDHRGISKMLIYVKSIGRERIPGRSATKQERHLP